MKNNNKIIIYFCGGGAGATAIPVPKEWCGKLCLI